jgi:hypothetical protein
MFRISISGPPHAHTDTHAPGANSNLRIRSSNQEGHQKIRPYLFVRFRIDIRPYAARSCQSSLYHGFRRAFGDFMAVLQEQRHPRVNGILPCPCCAEEGGPAVQEIYAGRLLCGGAAASLLLSGTERHGWRARQICFLSNLFLYSLDR